MDPRLQVQRLDHAKSLDPLVETVQSAANAAVPAGGVKDLLHGTWLGHPLHPVLTDLPIGFWTSAMLLDLAGGRHGRRGADRLIAAGIVTAVPTAVAGLADWTELERPAQRTGLVHAGANTLGLICYIASWVARRRGARASGVALSFVGAAAATLGGYLGGHLSYGRGAGVSRNAFETGAEDWTPVIDDADLAAGQPVRVSAGATAVMLYRDRGPESPVYAISAACSHVGGPLDEGSVQGGADPCVTCPWHGSRFRLRDGTVLRGPAQSPAPAFDARTRGGKVEIRRRGPAA